MTTAARARASWVRRVSWVRRANNEVAQAGRERPDWGVRRPTGRLKDGEGPVSHVDESPGTTPEAELPPTAPPADAKERFREALERKNAATHRSAAGASNGNAVHGPEVSGSNRRMFRRKAGG